MKNRLMTRTSIILAVFILFPVIAEAGTKTQRDWQDAYPDACQLLIDAADDCTLCHEGDLLNPYGQDYVDLGMTWAEMDPITDSDQDGVMNFVEITADCTLPQDGSSVSGVEGVPEVAVPANRILGNQPNPFNPSTTLVLQIQTGGPVRLEIFAADGRRVRRLFAGHLPAGRRTVEWDGRSDAGQALPSGMYFARLAGGGEASGHALMLVR